MGDESFRGVVANMLDCDIVVSEFELQSRYYVHLRTNTLGKGINLLLPELCFKWDHYCSSTKIALAFNDLQTLMCH